MNNKRIVIIGAAGRMGKALVSCLSQGLVKNLTLGGAVDVSTAFGQGKDVGLLAGVEEMGVKLSADFPALQNKGDIFIDFSLHAGISKRAKMLREWKKAWVIGTTGFTESTTENIRKASSAIPIVLAPNMSIGVCLLQALVKQAAKTMQGKGYDVEIIEQHHRKKLDAPSGTALFLGQAAAEGFGWNLQEVARHGRAGIAKGERPEKEIGFHAVRGGDIVGDHRVLFSTEGEMLELTHRATSRDTFALGALRAASWLSDKDPGLYSMANVLGL